MRERRSELAAVSGRPTGVVLVLAVLAAVTPRSAEAQSAPKAGAREGDAAAAPRVPPGQVLTFYGVRQLEQDPNVSDALKVKAWTAFIDRAKRQIAYAEKAAARWKEAAKLRLLEAARLVETDPERGPRDRIAQWQAVLDAYPDAPEARAARQRVAHWRAEETRRLVQAADAVERSGRPKLDRIHAWLAVTAWSPESREGRAAARRVAALQERLFEEAEAVDAIERLDAPTKLEAWRDVLKGDPTPEQRRRAESRVAQLEAGR